MSHSLRLNCRGRVVDLSQRTQIMGVINCTPDSFYAKSRNVEADAAVELGVRMVAEGADLLDVGGESTRPGAEPVSESEELQRIVPVIEGLLAAVDVPLSVDTYKARVAEEALVLGVHLVNDISALSFDVRMTEVAAKFDVPVILMHLKGKPKDMQKNPSYGDVVAEICHYLEHRIRYALEHGIKFENIVIDPGIGFGKRVKDNFEIIRRLDEFARLERPILLGPSRKSFIGKTLDLPPEESLEGTLAAASAAILAGADILRVHDVKEVVRAAGIADHIKGKQTP